MDFEVTLTPCALLLLITKFNAMSFFLVKTYTF